MMLILETNYTLHQFKVHRNYIPRSKTTRHQSMYRLAVSLHAMQFQDITIMMEIQSNGTMFLCGDESSSVGGVDRAPLNVGVRD